MRARRFAWTLRKARICRGLSPMWWVVFTAADLYIGLILLESLIPTLPVEKRGRAIAARKIVIGLLILSALTLAVMFFKR